MERRRTEKDPLDKQIGRPTLVAEVIGGRPAVRFKEGYTDGLQTSTAVAALSGNPNFTVFLLAKVETSERTHVQATGWGNGGIRTGTGMFVEFQAGRVDLGTGFSADVTTPAEAYATHFGKPTVIMCAKSAGSLDRTAQITFDGVSCPTDAPTLIPRVHKTAFIVGANTETQSISPAMDVAEIIVFNRLLTREEQNRVGYYLEEKYGLDTQFIKPEDFVPVELEVRAARRGRGGGLCGQGTAAPREHRRPGGPAETGRPRRRISLRLLL